MRLLASAAASLLIVAGVPELPAQAAPVEPAGPASPGRRSVPVQPVRPKSAAHGASEQSAPAGPSASWPTAGSAMVPLTGPPAAGRAVSGQATPGGLPVRIYGQAPVAGPVRSRVEAGERGQVNGATAVRVAVADQTVASRLGVHGVVLSVVRSDGQAAPARTGVEVSYARFASAYGGDYANRLRLVSLPACALSTPDLPSCQIQAPVPGARNNAATRTVSADAALIAGDPAGADQPAGKTASPTVLAVASDSTSGGNTWSATTLSAAYSWSAGNQGGDFGWTYPLRIPAALGGPAPDLKLQYSSGMVDGQTWSANGQASWVGEGWDLQIGYIERSYRTCSDDGGTTGDLCWYSRYNATMVFGGHSAALVRDNTTGVWHSANDDALRIELLTDTSLGNGDNDGEYWKVTTQDGTQYFFGKHRRFTGDTAVTNSVQTEPVFGNNSGEPCFNAAGFGSSWCQQAYRWNLDYVVDPRGNSLTYFWSKYTAKYGLNNNASAQPYDLSATVDHVDYGTRAGSEGTGSAPMKVVFGTAYRCINTCTPPGDYPDTPWDRFCSSTATTCPGMTSPSFFTPFRLSTVTTQVWNAAASAYRNVDKWELQHTYPTSGDNISPAGADTNPNLWLNNLIHTGYAADGVTTLAEPVIHFVGAPMANRVDWGDSLGVAPYMHYRLTTIVNGVGGQTVVAYSPVECPNGAPKQNSDANPLRCFPQYSKPIAAPAGFVWFNKYTATSVIEQDLTGGGPDEVWSYQYSTAGSTDNSLWAHDVNENTPIAFTSWGQWRGYSTVTVTHGAAGGPQTVTRTFYYRGLQWDAKKSGDDTQVVFGVRPAAQLSPLETGSGIQAGVAGGGATCLDVEFSGTGDGNPIKSYPCNNQPNQVWQRQPNNSLKNPASGRCLDVKNAGTTNGTLVQLWGCNNQPQQVWLRQPDGSLKNPMSGRCLDISNYATGPGGVVQIWNCTGVYNQTWQPVNTGALTSPGGNRCIDIFNGGTANATKVQNWNCNGVGAQEWTIQADGTVRNPQSGRCLDIAGGGTADGSLVQIFDCTAGSGQIWTIQADGTLKNPASGRCLDSGALATNGAQLTIRTCTGGASQQWVGRVLDKDGLQGIAREETSLDGSTIAVSTVHEPTITQTATRSAPVTGGQDFKAYLVRETSTKTRTWIGATSTWRWTRTDTSYDGLGLPIDTRDFADTTTGIDDTCTHLDYARNNTASTYIVSPVSQTLVTDCTASPAPSNYLGGALTIYDNTPNAGDPPTKGLPTQTLALASFSGTTKNWAQTGRTTYDSYGRPTDLYDALDRHTATAYTPSTGGPVTQVTVTNALGHVGTTQMEPGRGSTIQVTDANLKVTTAQYDPLGRLTKVFQPHTPAMSLPDVEYSYTLQSGGPNAVSTKRLGPGGNQIASFQLLDGRLRVRQTQTAADQANSGRIITDTTYDGRGLTAKVSTFWNSAAPTGSTLVAFADASVQDQHRYSYDNVERQTADGLYAAGVLKWQTTTGYDGDRQWSIPPAGGTPTMALFDVNGNPTALRQYTTGNPPSGSSYRTTSYGYDRLGRLTTTTDPDNNQWTSGYDLRSRVTATSDPDTGATTMAYDNAGQLISTTDSRGISLSATYDVLGRRTGLFDGTTATGFQRARWVYDTLAKGRVTSSTRNVSSTDAYTVAVTGYNDAYQATGTNVSLPVVAGQPAGDWQVTSTYNVDGSLATIAYPAGGGLPAETVTTGYDTTGRPLTLAGIDTYVSGTSYYGFGPVYQQLLGAAGKRIRLTTAIDEATGRLTANTTDTESTTLNTYTQQLRELYGYDDAGDVTAVNEVNATGTTVSQQCFGYDQLQQLTEAWTTTAASCQSAPTRAAVGGPDSYWTSYTYTASGSRATEAKHASAGDTLRTYLYPASGQRHTLTSVATSGASSGTDAYTYDAAGNTKTRTLAGQPGQTLTWDNEGHLGSVADTTGTSTYVYDADGNRLVGKDPGGVTIYLPGFELRQVGTTVTATRYYSDLAVRTPSGLTWLASDPHGSNQLAINASTLAVTRRKFDPFGNPRGATPAWPTSKGFVGGTRDTTGLTHLGAREYEPTTGRFVSADPVLDRADPQGMGGYSYAGNNPVTSSDPSGLCPADRCGDYGQNPGLSSGVHEKKGPNGLVGDEYHDRPKRTPNKSKPPVHGRVLFHSTVGHGLTLQINEDGTATLNGWVIPEGVNPFVFADAVGKVWDAMPPDGNYRLQRVIIATCQVANVCPGDLAPKLIADMEYDVAQHDDSCKKNPTCLGYTAMLAGIGGAMIGAEGPGMPSGGAGGKPLGRGFSRETAVVRYDPDFALGQLTQGRVAKASELDEFGRAQGWTRTKSDTGPIKYTDENGVVRITIKRGSPRTAGSETPHVEMRNANGDRVDPYGHVVGKSSPGNHTPIDYDLP